MKVMLKIERQAPSKKLLIIRIFAFLLFLAGLYGIFVILYPYFKLTSVNPNDNPTIQILKKEEPKITENRLYIPKIDINVPYNSGTEEVMEHGAWWRKPENGNPADGGNFVLSAHRFVMGLTPQRTLNKSPFYNIGKLNEGDQIVVDYEGKRYVYNIDKKYTTKPTDVDIENRTEKPQLTLYSCTFGGADDGRDVFIASLVGSGDNIKTKDELKK